MLKTVTTGFKLAVSLILIVPMLVLLLPVWLFVQLCERINRLFVHSDTTWDEMMRFEADIGWKPMADLNNVTYLDNSGDKGSVVSGEDGWPGNYSIEESEVVVFGDSFAFGYGSEYRDTYYGLSDDILIKPVAAPGYSMVQAVLLIKKYRKKLNGKLIVWLICLENDLAENIQPYNSMFYRIPYIKNNNSSKNWELVTSHVTKEKWLFGDNTQNALKFATICTPSAYSEKVMAGCKYLIDEAKETCEKIGAELVIFTIPDKRQLTKEGNQYFRTLLEDDAKYDEKNPDKILEGICKEFNVAFQAGMELLDPGDYKIRDSHWNKSGNKKISDFIRQHYERATNIKSS